MKIEHSENDVGPGVLPTSITPQEFQTARTQPASHELCFDTVAATRDNFIFGMFYYEHFFI